MFYASYANEDGHVEGHLFDSYAEYIDAVGAHTPIAIVDFKSTGRNYAERKESVRQVAIEYQHAECGGMFMSEYADATAWFRTMGKRYGLSAEFEREGVI